MIFNVILFSYTELHPGAVSLKTVMT